MCRVHREMNWFQYLMWDEVWKGSAVKTYWFSFRIWMWQSSIFTMWKTTNTTMAIQMVIAMTLMMIMMTTRRTTTMKGENTRRDKLRREMSQELRVLSHYVQLLSQLWTEFMYKLSSFLLYRFPAYDTDIFGSPLHPFAHQHKPETKNMRGILAKSMNGWRYGRTYRRPDHQKHTL